MRNAYHTQRRREKTEEKGDALMHHILPKLNFNTQKKVRCNFAFISSTRCTALVCFFLSFIFFGLVWHIASSYNMKETKKKSTKNKGNNDMHALHRILLLVFSCIMCEKNWFVLALKMHFELALRFFGE